MKYEVKVSVTYNQTIEVEAESAADAEYKATDLFDIKKAWEVCTEAYVYEGETK
jgi:hypothetical protein